MVSSFLVPVAQRHSTGAQELWLNGCVESTQVERDAWTMAPEQGAEQHLARWFIPPEPAILLLQRVSPGTPRVCGHVSWAHQALLL